MATNARDRAREIVQERQDAYNKKVKAGNAIPDTFQFHKPRYCTKEDITALIGTTSDEAVNKIIAQANEETGPELAAFTKK